MESGFESGGKSIQIGSRRKNLLSCPTRDRKSGICGKATNTVNRPYRHHRLKQFITSRFTLFDDPRSMLILPSFAAWLRSTAATTRNTKPTAKKGVCLQKWQQARTKSSTGQQPILPGTCHHEPVGVQGPLDNTGMPSRLGGNGARGAWVEGIHLQRAHAQHQRKHCQRVRKLRGALRQQDVGGQREPVEGGLARLGHSV
mmetsp:Transcript_27618/g.69229  ORF Transcript_27618/g.69229 Transcript_27618/m.69229 type:complete len:200 (+) Transcript_27618:1385-1984(+)